MELTDRVVVVTGAARGIGFALARRFKAANARAVVAVDVDREGAEKAAAEVGGVAIQADVSREVDIERVAREVESRFGAIDVFCSNAGIAVAGGPETPDAEWQRIWDVNVMSHVYVARHVVPAMIERGGGYLVGTVSAAGLLNHIFAAPYATTKAAALSLFEWLSITYGERGLRVSCLCPQGVKTDMLAAERRRGLDFLTAGALEPEAVADSVVAAMHDERFLILPHPEVAEFFRRKAEDYDRWLRGMRKLRARVLEGMSE